MTARPALRAREAGQAAVELALGLPLVAVALLAVAQVVLVAAAHVAVVHAAREGARAAAVAGEPWAPATPAERAADGERAARNAAGLDPARLAVAVHTEGERVRVTVRYRTPTAVPLVGAVVGDLDVAATATMLVEP